MAREDDQEAGWTTGAPRGSTYAAPGPRPASMGPAGDAGPVPVWYPPPPPPPPPAWETVSFASIVLVILAIFLPPASALLTDGCGAQLCLNILLTLLGWLPGLLHAWYLIARQDRRERRRRYREYAGYYGRVPAGGAPAYR